MQTHTHTQSVYVCCDTETNINEKQISNWRKREITNVCVFGSVALSLSLFLLLSLQCVVVCVSFFAAEFCFVFFFFFPSFFSLKMTDYVS